MHTRSVFLKHEDARERDSGKVLQTFNSSRHYLFNNERKRFREQSDFHGQKLGSCPEGRKDHRQWFLYVSGRDAKKRVWQLEKREERKSCSFYLIYFVCFYISFPLSMICSSFLLSLLNCFILFYAVLSTKKYFFFIFLLSAFSVPLLYTTLNIEPQHFSNFLQVHPHVGHTCVHMTAVVSPDVACVLLAVQKLVRTAYNQEHLPLLPGGSGYLTAHKSSMDVLEISQKIWNTIGSPVWFSHTFTWFLLFKSALRNLH